MTNKIYILLPIYNRKDITIKFVSFLKEQDYKNYKLILIDDGSVDGTADAVCIQLPKTTVITGKGNWWWAGSLEQGYKWLKKEQLTDSDIVLIINDDTEISNDFISKGISILNKNKKTLLLATAYDLKTGTLHDCGVLYDFNRNIRTIKNKGIQPNCLTTRGLFLTAKDFIDLGGFYPVLLPHYLSDYEFSIRAFRRGYNLVCSDEIQLKVDTLTSGIRNVDFGLLKLNQFLKLYFSKSYLSNPIYSINFYLIAFPFPYNIKHAFKVVITFFKRLRVVVQNSIIIKIDKI